MSQQVRYNGEPGNRCPTPEEQNVAERKPPNPTTPGTGLDAKKRNIVLAILANGNSRRFAARYVGCAASTIARAAARDPDFQAQIVRAEQSAQVDLLRRIRLASRAPRYWRAAAWTLERLNADDFGPRPHNTLSVQQVSDLFIQVFDYILDEPTDDQIERALKKLDELVNALFDPPLCPLPAAAAPQPSDQPTAPEMAAAGEPPLEDWREDPIATGNEPPLEDCFEGPRATHPAEVVVTCGDKDRRKGFPGRAL